MAEVTTNRERRARPSFLSMKMGIDDDGNFALLITP